jgi:hypothetical protein
MSVFGIPGYELKRDEWQFLEDMVQFIVLGLEILITNMFILKDALQQTNNSDCGIYALTKLRNWISQFIHPSLPTRHLSPQTASFARDHIALDLATQTLDSFANWAERELRTPSPKSPSSPLPPHHPKKGVIKDPIPFKGFKPADTDTDTDTSGTDSDQHTSDPFNIPPPPIVRATKAGGVIKNFYVLIDTLPPKITALPNLPATLPSPVLQQSQPDDENDVLMDIITSPSRSPVLVRRLDPPMESVFVMGIVLKMGSTTPKTLPILPKRLPGPSTSHYQGTPWEDNSCWLDSGEWEALYAVSLYDRAFWMWEFDNTPLTHPLESRIGDLRRSFTARNLVYSYASQKEVPGLLRKIRNGYQQRLLMPKGNAPLDKIGDQESPFVSTIPLKSLLI